MTVFGRSNFLLQQLESILNQTVKINELIVVEDFSGAESPLGFDTGNLFRA